MPGAGPLVFSTAKRCQPDARAWQVIPRLVGPPSCTSHAIGATACSLPCARAPSPRSGARRPGKLRVLRWQKADAALWGAPRGARGPHARQGAPHARATYLAANQGAPSPPPPPRGAGAAATASRARACHGPCPPPLPALTPAAAPPQAHHARHRTHTPLPPPPRPAARRRAPRKTDTYSLPRGEAATGIWQQKMQNPTGTACAAAPRSLQTLARAGSLRAASGRFLKTLAQKFLPDGN